MNKKQGQHNTAQQSLMNKKQGQHYSTCTTEYEMSVTAVIYVLGDSVLKLENLNMFMVFSSL